MDEGARQRNDVEASAVDSLGAPSEPIEGPAAGAAASPDGPSGDVARPEGSAPDRPMQGWVRPAETPTQAGPNGVKFDFNSGARLHRNRRRRRHGDDFGWPSLSQRGAGPSERQFEHAVYGGKHSDRLRQFGQLRVPGGVWPGLGHRLQFDRHDPTPGRRLRQLERAAKPHDAIRHERAGTLDAADVITLVGVTKTSLTQAGFSFK